MNIKISLNIKKSWKTEYEKVSGYKNFTEYISFTKHEKVSGYKNFTEYKSFTEHEKISEYKNFTE